ncbi:MAG: pyridoxamine 5'-phosphate oxidase family protein [Paludibacteraceae bacterium]|nr:pyridoxamine 5'-phosphate oxidase family protein [Paludibacteraceae bacterium]
MEGAKKVFEFLEDAKSFYLATVEGDQPRVRVYGAQLLFEDKLYLMSFARTAATDQLKANCKAEFCAFKGMTLRVECKLVEDARQEVKDAMLAHMPALKPILGEKGEKAVMWEVKDATATFFKMMEPVETIKF